MSGIGKPVDLVAGALTRILHGFRGASVNTVGDLGPYLGAPVEVMFPEPVVPRDLKRERALVSVGPRTTETLRWHSQHVPLCPHYRSRHAGEYERNTRVVARFIHPKGGERKRALVYVHGWLEPGPWVEEASFLPRLHDDLDVDVLHVQLPFHGSRNPKSALFHGEFFWSADLVRSLEAVRQSALDVRTLIAWLRARGYVEVGVTGLSLGGAITMLLACASSPPDYIVPIIAHLQLAEAVEEASILWRMKEDLERFGIGRDERRELFAKLGLGTFRPVLAPDRQLWVAAREDQYIKADLVEAQWREWGRPPIEWIPGGHMTLPLHIGKVLVRLKGYLATMPSRRVAIAHAG
jgi:hypothetical protein